MKTDYRKLLDKPYLGAWDMPENGDMVVTIKSVETGTVINERHEKEEKILIYFKEAKKAMVCNVTNAKLIKKATGSKFVEDWVGRTIALYATEVSAFGETMDAIRVRPYAPKLEKLVCANCGKEIQDHSNYSAKSIAESSRGTYGRALCWECAQKAKKEAEEKAKESDVL